MYWKTSPPFQGGDKGVVQTGQASFTNFFKEKLPVQPPPAPLN